jgi:hypothetical protein
LNAISKKLEFRSKDIGFPLKKYYSSAFTHLKADEYLGYNLLKSANYY